MKNVLTITFESFLEYLIQQDNMQRANYPDRLLQLYRNQELKDHAAVALSELVIFTQQLDQSTKNAHFWATIYAVLTGHPIMLGGLSVYVEFVAEEPQDPWAFMNEGSAEGGEPEEIDPLVLLLRAAGAIQTEPEEPLRMRPFRDTPDGPNFYVLGEEVELKGGSPHSEPQVLLPGVDFFISADDGLVDKDGNPLSPTFLTDESS